MVKLNSSNSSSRSQILRYGIAVLSVTAAAITLLSMEIHLRESAPVALFLIATIVSTWFGGVKPGLLAAMLSILAFACLFLSPALTFQTSQIIRVLALAILASFVVWITSTQRNAVESLKRAHDDLTRNNEALRAENIERKQNEKELQRQKEILQSIFDHVPAMIALEDASGRVLMANQEFERTLGWSVEEVTRQDFSLETESFPDPEVRQKVRDLIGRADGKSEDFITRTKDGRVIDTSWAKVRLSDGSILGVGKDTTDIKRAQEALSRSEAYLAEGQRISHTGSWAWNVPTGAWFWSLESLRIFDFDPSSGDFSYEMFLQRVHNEDRAKVERTLDEGVRNKAEFDHYHRIVTPTGITKFVHCLGRPVLNEAGELTEFIGVVMDITEHEQAAKAVRESQQLLHLVLATLPVGVTVTDREGDILLVNEASKNIWGGMITSGRERWEKSKGFWHESGKRIAPGFWASARALSEGQAILNELVDIETYDGRQKIMRNTAVPIRNPEGLIVGVVLVNEDVTERVRAEEDLKRYRIHLEEMVEARTAELSAANKKLKELDRLKSMFVASMSHELRTPLNSIIGFTGMTLQGLSGELNEEQKDNLSRAYHSAKHLLDLISDVIDISKIEAGRIEAFPEKFSIREVVDEAIATIDPRLKDKGLELKVDVRPDTYLNTDRKRVLQCLINIISNAVKYTETGGITVTSRETDGQVWISVSDTGIGIAQKDMNRLFVPFERLENHLRVKAGGTGLGLYLTRKLITDVLHGEISVTSEEGKGSTFTLRLPRDLEEAPQATIEQGSGNIL